MVAYEVRYEATEEADGVVRVVMSVWRQGAEVAVLVAEAAAEDISDIAESEGVVSGADDDLRRHVIAALACQVAQTIEGKPLDRRDTAALPVILERPNAAHLLAWARLHDHYPALEPRAVVHRFPAHSGDVRAP